MAERRAGIFSVLKDHDFLALWLGQLVSKIGDNFAVIAALVLINEKAASPGIAVVVVATALTIPQLFALASGVLVDRFDRKWLMISMDLARAVAILPVLLIQTPGQLYILYLSAFAIQLFGAIFVAARNASIPNMVAEDQLLTANALIQATDLLSLIIGALLATLIIGLTSTFTAFIIDSVSFVASAVLLLTTHIPRGAPQVVFSNSTAEFRRFWHSFTDGLRYIRCHPYLLQLMAITMLATLGLSATVLVAVAYFKQLFNISPAFVGLLQAMEGIGMALGAVLIGAYATWARSRRIVSVTMIVLGASILVFVFAPQYWMVLIGALIVGLCIVSARSTLAAMTQALVPDAQRGRVESAMVTVTGIGTMGALVLAGILGDVIGPRYIFLITGLAVLAAGITSVFTLRGAEGQLTNGGNEQPPPPLE
jgi:DHA3 family macrolide efflux protein-like MFS transporter